MLDVVPSALNIDTVPTVVHGHDIPRYRLTTISHLIHTISFRILLCDYNMDYLSLLVL